MILQLAATFAVAEQKHYATAGSIAEEVLSAIRTVVAFGTESKETARSVAERQVCCVMAPGAGMDAI